VSLGARDDQRRDNPVAGLVADLTQGLGTEVRDAFGSDPLADLAARLDPVGFSWVIGRAALSLAGRPVAVARAGVDYAGGSARALWASGLRAAGLEVDGPATPPARDRRHGDRAYTDNAWFYLCRQQHLLLAGWLRELAGAADVDLFTRRKLDFLVEQVVAATAPANFPATNPVVLKRAFDTGGQSLARGLGNLLRDVLTNDGLPRKVTPGRFQVGEDLAVTPGKVVFRNRLIELIQYAPATETVHEVPILFSPPWINKYYIMDLAPGKSLVQWAVEHGHTCFMISYRNPDESLRGLGMSDYLRDGPLAALEVIRDITGADRVNGVALCLGGTLLGAASAWLAARGDDRINSLTLTNTLLDFTEPGQLGVFTDPETVANLGRLMRDTGYLPAEKMATTFDLLRPEDLHWNYVVNDWLLGDEPAPFDMLAWNSDSTRMPEAMQAEYLGACYVRNDLAAGRLVLAGQRLDLGSIRHDAYLVTAEGDHIAPWRTVYRGAGLLGGRVRFVLSNSGHIAGVVNPPGPKSRHRVSEGTEWPADPGQWRAGTEENRASWWEDWTPWIAERAGARREPPPLGSERFGVLADAPGSYVFT
jgi:polyhydroxyalkanoate synthase subunit PhaC